MSNTSSSDLSADVPRGEPARRAYFDALFAGSDDPWDLRARWYEVRKRALTVACVPHARYRNAYEPGCASGELSVLLAARCDRLLVSDGSEAAVALTRARVQALPHVEARRIWLPAEWPDEQFDLIVLSEFVYYLDAEAVDLLASAAQGSLRAGGAILACHYRPHIGGCALAGDDVHLRLDARLGLPIMTTLVELDFRIEVWCADPPAVS